MGLCSAAPFCSPADWLRHGVSSLRCSPELALKCSWQTSRVSSARGACWRSRDHSQAVPAQECQRKGCFFLETRHGFTVHERGDRSGTARGLPEGGMDALSSTLQCNVLETGLWAPERTLCQSMFVLLAQAQAGA